MSESNGHKAEDLPTFEKPPREGFRRIITVDCDEKGNWELNFGIHPDAVLLFLQKIQYSMLSGTFKVNDKPIIIKPTPGDIKAAS